MTNLLHKNPFSVYDFLGYLFPGACVLYFIMIAINLTDYTVEEIKFLFTDNSFLSSISILKSFLFILGSYVLGHIIAYLSSITIERWTLWLFGYPSEFLLEQRKKTTYWSSNVTSCGTEKIEEISCDHLAKSLYLYLLKRIIRLIMGVLLFPISIPYLLLTSINIKGFITKPLDKHLQNCINDKLISLMSIISFDTPDQQNVDYSRIIYHYYIQEDNHSFIQKTDNYIALYGFLRAITLTLCIMTVYLTVISIISCNLMSNCFIICLLSFLSFVSFLAFMKFYRRYSLEIFMFMVSDKTIKVKI